MEPDTATNPQAVEDYLKLLLAFRALPETKRSRTFMEVSGYPHYENVCSNILRFYLDPAAEHGLSDLLLSAFLRKGSNHKVGLFFATGLALDDWHGSRQARPMPRTMRVEYPGAIYHVMDRGDRREDIFLDDVDRLEFLKTLAEGSQKAGWQVHAYCLMRNHFHLVLETPDANLVAGMRWFLSAYTIRLNHRQKLFGHVFSGRYKALLVEGSGNGYLPIKWIAARLQMGTTKSARSMLHRWMQLQEKSPCTQLQFQPMV